MERRWSISAEPIFVRSHMSLASGEWSGPVSGEKSVPEGMSGSAEVVDDLDAP